jgi:transposase
MVDNYRKIYVLNEATRGQSPKKVLEVQNRMRLFFTAMKAFSEVAINRFSSKSGINRSFNYLLSNYDGFTLFLDNPKILIDNNASERLLRAPVLGRKTWYGIHSKSGAEAGAIHLSLVEVYKMVNANPRTYYKELVARLHV